jgi:16S rRNA (cytosine1402-N4)-methyltransferase
MDPGSETAGEVLNSRSENELAFIFREYGEEHHASRIARAIVHDRKTRPLQTTSDLSKIIESVVGGKSPQKSKARIFQALRIYVNDEIEELRNGLDGAVGVLRKNGRLCVISYHSLEDRAVKHFIREKSLSCICDPGIPQCKCDIKPLVKPVTRKSVVPSEKEIEMNPRARSARLRACEKI